ncbi:MAG: hypothetical protein HYR67_03520 [Bacteroidetes bacterium]|nr:hypothetical protein [Bacteroidota bacterium]
MTSAGNYFFLKPFSGSLLSILCLTIGFGRANAQSISGPTSVCASSTTSNHYILSGCSGSPTWHYPAAAQVVGGGNGLGYIDIVWAYPGSGYGISVTGGCTASLNTINVYNSPSISSSIDPMGVSSSNNLTLTATNGSNYQWRFGSVLNPILSTSVSYVPTKGGTYYLTANSLCGTTPTTSRLVNYFPIADAGLDKNIGLPISSYTLNGTGYDPDDNDSFTLLWSQLSGPTISMANTNSSALTLSNIVTGTYTFRLTVTDSHSKSSTDDIIVTASALTNNYNYLQEDKVLVDGQTTSTQVQGLPIGNKITTFSYQDDLGRAVEKVKVKGSPSGNDIVTFKVFDGLGREATSYLPYANASTSGNFIPVSAAQSTQQTFYNTANDKIADDVPYSQRTFELSPMSRVIQQGSSGSSWQLGVGAKTFGYGTNGAGYILQWSLNAATGLPQIDNSVYYMGALLSKKTVTDEQGVASEVYSNINGLKIATRTDAGGGVWAETYYVYDLKNNLKFVLPPELIKILKAANNSSPTQTQLDRWANQYNYDNLNRLVESKTPGAGWVYTIYDARNRVVLTQDANQRNGDAAQSIPANKWSYTKYDEQNSPVISGIYGPDNIYTTRSAMQEYVDGLASGQGYQNISTSVSNGVKSGMEFVISAYEGINEYRSITSITLKPGFYFIGGTTSTSFRASIDNGSGTDGVPADIFPIANDEALAITYYDSYANCNICSDPNYQFVAEAWTTTGNTEPFNNYTRIKGSVVASSIKILGTSTWLNTVSYYNRGGQAIQVIGSNHLGGRDRISTYVDFSGKKLEELQTAIGYNSGGISTMRKVFSYDPVSLLPTSVKHQINSQPMITLSALEYNELGQVVKKKLHSVDGTNFLQKIDYRYNIRNWLTNINNIPTANDTGDDSDDYFGMDLTYVGTIAGIGAVNTPRKDGFINDIRWKQDLGLKRRVYNFSYDNLGRVTSSNQIMSKDNSVTWTGEQDFFSETGLTYDLNGNILSLNRNTEYFNNGSNGASIIDQLSYVYGSNSQTASDNGNQLQYVKENSISATNQLGFKDGGSNTIANPDYQYDANGNMKKDQNKGIVNMTYYFNNLPNKVTFSDGSYLQYTYDAAGIKLSQAYVAFASGSPQPPVVTDYISSIVLLQGQVLVVNHSEGRITAPTYANLLSNPEAGSLDGYTANQNVTLATNYTSGQTYVSAVCNQTTSTPGIFPINSTKGTSIPVKQGESYIFKILGYQSVGSSASLYVKTNSGDLIWPGVSLMQGSANENWVNATFTIPNGVTSIQLGVQWSAPAVGNTFYINRVALYKTDFEYNYFINDQVGSTRVVMQTTPGVQQYTATMEPHNQPSEDDTYTDPNTGVKGKFHNMDYSKVFLIGNTTPGGSYALKMNSAFKIGPSKSLKVYPGDQISATVNSSYTTEGTYTKTPLAVVMAAVTPVFGGVSGSGDPGSIFTNLNNTSNPIIAGLSPNQGSSTPSAFLNYILFDKDYTPISGQSAPVPQGGGGLVSIPAFQVQELGYVFIYLSYDNDSGNDVYFDDLKIIAQESNVIQVNNYYPFGMESYSWLRSGETDNAYLFQGKELIAQTGWHDFGSRMYYADLGRWFATDPQNQFASPYLAMGNMPMMGRDSNGEWFGIDDVIVAGVGFVYGYVSYGVQHGDWGGHALANGGINAALFELGYLTAGGGLTAAGGAAAAEVETASAAATISNAGAFIGSSAISIAASSVVPSMPLYQDKNFSLSISPTFSLTGAGASLNASYTDGDWSVGGGIGATGSYKGRFESRVGGSVSYFDGTSGGSIGFTHFGGTDQQTNWMGTYRYRSFHFSLTNDAFIDKIGKNLGGGDKYRTAAAEIGIGDYSVGFNIYTGIGSNKETGVSSPIWGPHIPRRGAGAGEDQGAWRNGEVMSSNLYFGYRHGGMAYRVGIDAPFVQDFFQNGVHRYITKTTPYFMDYGRQSQPYFFMRTYDPYSLY